MALFKIVKQLLEIHIELHSLGIQHGDMHTGNFFVKTEKDDGANLIVNKIEKWLDNLGQKS